MTKKQKTLVNMGSRERSLIYSYVLLKADSNDVKKTFGIDLTIVVVGEGSRGKITTWYQPEELSEVTKVVVEKAKTDSDFYPHVKSEFFKHWETVLKYIKKEKVIESFKEAHEVYEHYYQWWSALSYTLDSCKVSEDIKKEYESWRIQNEKYTEEVDKLFVEYILSRFPQYTGIVNIITPDEMLSLENGPFNEDVMNQMKFRENGYVLYKESTYPVAKLNELLEANSIVLDSEEPDKIHDSLQGVVASIGKIKGKVRIIKYKEELASLEEGEILVAEATTPDYISAIKKASAVVTDEGGMMSHAAITCRELKKICIVGTAWATKTFKTGEIVEVDATGIKGVISRVV